METRRVIEDRIEYIVCEYSNGDKIWYLGCACHRENGPAEERLNGDKFWWKHGKIHRTDGPAIIYSNGTKGYWLNNIKYSYIETDEEWILYQIIT